MGLHQGLVRQHGQALLFLQCLYVSAGIGCLGVQPHVRGHLRVGGEHLHRLIGRGDHHLRVCALAEKFSHHQAQHHRFAIGIRFTGRQQQHQIQANAQGLHARMVEQQRFARAHFHGHVGRHHELLGALRLYALQFDHDVAPVVVDGCLFLA